MPDFGSLVATFEGLAYGGGNPGILFAIAAQLLSVQHPILTFGTEPQKSMFLPRMIAGDLRVAHAASEPQAGSDVFGILTTAKPDRGGYLLNGTKRYITSSPVADFALVLASTQPERKHWGITAFLLDLKTDGVMRSKNIPKMGLQSAEFGELQFDDCFVPIENRLGEEGGGAAIFNFALELERSLILAPVLGVMRLQLERAVEEANHRTQRNRTIGGFQSVSNRIADMSMRLELSRLAIYHAAALRDAGQPSIQYSAIVKLAVSEFHLASSLDAMRIFGAAGYLLNDPAEVGLRDAMGGVFYSGTSDILRNLVAHAVGVIDA